MCCNETSSYQCLVLVYSQKIHHHYPLSFFYFATLGRKQVALCLCWVGESRWVLWIKRVKRVYSRLCQLWRIGVGEQSLWWKQSLVEASRGIQWNATYIKKCFQGFLSLFKNNKIGIVEWSAYGRLISLNANNSGIFSREICAKTSRINYSDPIKSSCPDKC